MKCKIEGCNNECMPKRRICHAHRLEQTRNYYHTTGHRTTYHGICAWCGNNFEGSRKEQKYCSKDCANSAVKLMSSNATNNYARGHGHGYCYMHRRLAEEILGRKLSSNEVVHHLDFNPQNSVPENLIVLSRSNHNKLHSFIAKGVEELKNSIENVENCKNNLIAPLTKTWLETASVNVIKLAEIGQPAAELPPDKTEGEGSETMHDGPTLSTDNMDKK